LYTYVVGSPNSLCYQHLRSWFIWMRSPTSRPGVFVPSNAAYHSEAALSFGSRTNIPITFPMTRDSSEFQTENRNVSRHHHQILHHPRQVCHLRHLGTRFPLYPVFRSSTLCFPRHPSLRPDDDLMTSILLFSGHIIAQESSAISFKLIYTQSGFTPCKH